MNDLNKARKWANTWSDSTVPAHTRAAVDIIQSLPDRWVDAEKLKAIIADMGDSLEVEATTDFSKGFDNATMSWLGPLKSLLVPKLPTLADMSEEEREACQWMQADVKLSAGNDSVTCVIADPRKPGAKVRVWAPHGGSDDIEASRITPLPNLPKLQWPGNEVVEPPALPEGMRLADHEEYGRVVASPRTDEHGYYRALRLHEGYTGGALYDFAKPSELTFLDGEA